MDRDLEEKAGLLLKAQRAYIDTIKYGNARWASAAGFQVGSLYEELYDGLRDRPGARPSSTGEARRSTSRSCRRRSASCSRSRCAGTARTC